MELRTLFQQCFISNCDCRRRQIIWNCFGRIFILNVRITRISTENIEVKTRFDGERKFENKFNFVLWLITVSIKKYGGVFFCDFISNSSTDTQQMTWSKYTVNMNCAWVFCTFPYQKQTLDVNRHQQSRRQMKCVFFSLKYRTNTN